MGYILFSDNKGNIVWCTQCRYRDIQHASCSRSSQLAVGLSDGYDTIVGEQEVGLSGVNARESLARALLKNATIMIFDDITSSTRY